MARYGLGEGPIQLDNVGCIGTESSILECSYTADHDCTHFEDAGIRCNTTCMLIQLTIGAVYTPFKKINVDNVFWV